MSWCSDAPEDEAISLFAGLLTNPDMTLNPLCFSTESQVTCFVVFRQLYGLDTSSFNILLVICNICSKQRRFVFENNCFHRTPPGTLAFGLDLFLGPALPSLLAILKSSDECRN